MRPVTALLVAMLLGSAFPAAAAGAATASPDLLRRALDPNPTLQTYSATATLNAVLHALVPIHKTINGTAYYRKPLRKIIFTNAPSELKQFSQLTASTPTWEQVQHQYKATPLTDDGTASAYQLVPTDSAARVQSLTVRIGDASHLIQQATWKYKNGETLQVTPTFTTDRDFHVASSVAISAHFPHYNVEGTMTFTDYKFNVAVPI